MTWVDAVIIVIAIIFAIVGYKQGLVRLVLTFAGLIVGVVLAGQFGDEFGEVLGGAGWSDIVAFVIIVIVVMIGGSLIGAILGKILRFMMLGWLDKIGGFVIGILVGALLCAAFFTIMGDVAYLNEIGWLKDAIGDSPLASLLIEHFGLLLALLPGELGGRVRELF